MFPEMPLAALLPALVLGIGPAQLDAPVPEASPQIYGGDAVEDPQDYFEVVAIQAGGSLCTGTVVAPTLVLTAAHCLEDISGANAILVFFGNDITAPVGGAPLTASAFGVHPDYCTSGCDTDINDVGYIVLSQAVSLDFAEPLVDPDTYVEVVGPGTEVQIVGFGQTEDGSQGEKRVVRTSIRSFSDSGAEFLAGGDGKDSCNGDSGGPALVELPGGERKLVGILSRGFACGDGGIYGSPYPALCWIRDETGVAATIAIACPSTSGKMRRTAAGVRGQRGLAETSHPSCWSLSSGCSAVDDAGPLPLLNTRRELADRHPSLPRCPRRRADCRRAWRYGGRSTRHGRRRGDTARSVSDDGRPRRAHTPCSAAPHPARAPPASSPAARAASSGSPTAQQRRRRWLRVRPQRAPGVPPARPGPLLERLRRPAAPTSRRRR